MNTAFASPQPETAEVLANVPWVMGNPWVIPGRVPGERMRNLNDPWEIVRERAALHDVRLHDLRHSFASRALALGESLLMIGRLLGHSRVETTSRYAHIARDSVRESTERFAASIAEDMLQENPLEHIEPVAAGHRHPQTFPPRCGTTSKSGSHLTPSSVGKALHE